MFNIGEYVTYSLHGICQIDGISEKSYLGISRFYYDLHPIENCSLRISTPVDNNKASLLRLLYKDEAEVIMETFLSPGIGWIEVNSERTQTYSRIVKNGNRKEIAQIASTLMKEKYKVESIGRKFHERDVKLLDTVKSMLFSELAMSLDSTYEEINAKINDMVTESMESDSELDTNAKLV